MPYKSQAQERYFNANRSKLEAQGVDVGEWNSASKGMKLPKKKAKYDGDEVAETMDPINKDRAVSAKARANIKRIKAGKDFAKPEDAVDPADKPVKKETPKPDVTVLEAPSPRKFYPAMPETEKFDGTEYDASQDPNSGYTPFSNYGTNLGGGIHPWDNTWGNVGGAYSAQMDPTLRRGIRNTSNFNNSGNGLDPGREYLTNSLQGRYLTDQTNPYLSQMNQGMRGLQADQDEQERRRIGSAMAAGGNALSGARMEADQRYQNLSNANFNRDWGGILSNNYQNERRLQQQSANELPDYARTQMQGNRDEINAGMIPTQMEQNDIDRQRADWERQTNNMYRDYTQGGKTFNDLIHGGYQGSQQPNYGESGLAGILGLLGGGSKDGILGQLLQKLLGGGKGNSGGGGSHGSGGSGSNGGGGRPGQPGEPVTDENGQPVLDSFGQPITYDEDGNPVNSEGYLVNPDTGEMVPYDNYDQEWNDQNMNLPPGYDPYQDESGGWPSYDPSSDASGGGGEWGYDDNGGDYTDGSEGW